MFAVHEPIFAPTAGRIPMTPLLDVQGLTKSYGRQIGCADVAFTL